MYFLVQRHVKVKYKLGVAPNIKFHTNETIGATFSKGAYVYAQNMADPATHGDKYNELLQVLDDNFWDIDTDLSDRDAIVYVPREVVGPDGHDPMPANARAIVVAYRGTDVHGMSGFHFGGFGELDVHAVALAHAASLFFFPSLRLAVAGKGHGRRTVWSV